MNCQPYIGGFDLQPCDDLADEICPPATQDTVYERLQCPKRRLFYPAFGHEEIQAFDDALIAFFGKEGL